MAVYLFCLAEPVFGSELAEFCKQQGTNAPAFLVQFVDYIEEFGSHYDNVYQDTSETKCVASLRYLVEKGNNE